MTTSTDLQDCNVVVTGSSSGIGRAIACEMASAGANVLIHGRSNEAGARRTESECRDLGVKTEVVLADLAEDSGRQALVDAAWKCFDSVHVWVNNAGADVLTGDDRELSYESKLRVLWNVDVLGTIFLSRAAADRMRADGGGVILNMGWDQALTGMEGDSGEYFAATKGAIMAFTRSFARSVAPLVRVNCLAPGWIRTAWGDEASEYWQQRVLDDVPLQRWGKAVDVARVARFVASPGAAFISGQVIPINGGAT